MTPVISVRLPLALKNVLRTDAAHWKLKLPKFVDFLLRCSLACDADILRLQPSTQYPGSKLDIRLTAPTYEHLSKALQQLSTTPTVYIRTLLHNCISLRNCNLRNGRALHASGSTMTKRQFWKFS